MREQLFAVAKLSASDRAALQSLIPLASASVPRRPSSASPPCAPAPSHPATRRLSP